jgi:hypothetical protein
MGAEVFLWILFGEGAGLDEILKSFEYDFGLGLGS